MKTTVKTTTVLYDTNGKIISTVKVKVSKNNSSTHKEAIENFTTDVKQRADDRIGAHSKAKQDFNSMFKQPLTFVNDEKGCTFAKRLVGPVKTGL